MQRGLQTQSAMFLNKHSVKRPLVERRLASFFCLAYGIQGIAQHFCLVAQPLDFYLMKVCRLTAAEVSGIVSLFMIPWVIKPLYGCVSDFFPLLGQKAKPYLVLAFVFAALGYLAVAAVSGSAGSRTFVFWAIFFASMGMAMGNTFLNGLTVRAGNRTGLTRRIFSVQALSYYLTNLLSMLFAGWLCQAFGPLKALPLAAAAAALPCLLGAVFSWFMVNEKEESLSELHVSEAWSALKRLFAFRGFWLAAAFISLWNFSPGLTTPLYFFESNKLHFSQAFIGQLGAINAFGMLLGAGLFRLFAERLAAKTTLIFSVIFGALVTLCYVLLSSETSAMILEASRGVSSMLACLAVYGLVAEVCLKKVEGFAIALLISIYNLAGQAGTVFGGQLYDSLCEEGLAPLLLVSAGTTLLCLALCPEISRISRQSTEVDRS